MNREKLCATLLGFLGAFAIFGALLYFVGVDGFLRELATADREMVVLVVLATLGWLAAWGYGLQTVLAALGVEISFREAFLVLNGAMFSNNITPFGQTGGESITALLISKVTGTEYERGLAAIASVDSLNFLPSIALALLGAGYYASQTAFGRRVQLATASIVALAVTIPVVGYVAWEKRESIQMLLTRGLTAIATRGSDTVPGLHPPTQGSVGSRVDRFIDAIERIATTRRGVAITLAASTIGWTFQMIALWFAFVAIGSSISIEVLLFVIPVGAIAGITPLPGGVGGIEATLVTLLSTLPRTGVGVEATLAAVVIYRGAVYWIPVTIGGSVVSILGANSV